MRLLLKANIPVEDGNEHASQGTLGSTIQGILDDLKPEAAYFSDDSGERCAYLFVEVESSADIPRLCEPWFQAFNAGVELHPVMAPEDLAKAADSIKDAVEKYG